MKVSAPERRITPPEFQTYLARVALQDRGLEPY